MRKVDVHEVLKGIDKAGFGDVPLVGGSVGGPDGRAFANDRSTGTGVSIALLCTELPIGWSYEGGYDMLDKHSGVVTKTNGRRIVEIDRKPAFEVYDQWMDGKVSRFLEDKSYEDGFRDFLSLHPLARLRTAPDGTTCQRECPLYRKYLLGRAGTASRGGQPARKSGSRVPGDLREKW